MTVFSKAEPIQSGATQGRAVIDYPDRCPLCDNFLQPAFVCASVLTEHEGEAIFRCTRNGCGRYFIAHCSNVATGHWSVERLAPQVARPHAFSKDVQELSPSFVAIFNDALAAESAGLHNLVGIGLRKALEFLVKDFCITRNTAQADAIKKKFLGNVIKEDVTDAKLKACAERAVWLGNDETHYERRWQGKDVNDLKTLIRLTVHWVESEILTAKFEGEMPPTGGKS